MDKKETKEGSDSETEMYQHTGNYLAKSQYLPKGILDIKICTDANKEAPQKVSLSQFFYSN